VWHAIWAIAYKEVIEFVRSGALRKHFMFQSLEFAMLAWINITARNLPTVVVDQDHTSESRMFVQRLESTQVFRVAYSTTSIEQARAHIKGGRAKIAIVIPPDYAHLRASGATARVLALVDGADATASSQAITALDGVTSRMNLELHSEDPDDLPTVTPHSLLLFNPQRRTSTFLLPGLLAITLALGFVNMISRAIVQEREAGTIERLLMTPLNSTGLILGKMATYFAFGMANALILLAVMHFGFDMPMRGSWELLLLGTTLYMLTILSLGALIAAMVDSVGLSNAVTTVLFVAPVTLSGFIYPLTSVPRPLLVVSYSLPQTHFIELVRGLCLRGASLSELAPAFTYLAVTPVVLGVAACIRFSRSLQAE
jgi:ABC-2 type transport system permease protein